MANALINRKRFSEYLGKKLSDKELQDRVSMFGASVESFGEKEFEVEVLPNRPDLFSEEGLARGMRAFLGIAPGLKKYEVKKSGTFTRVEKPLKIWPYAVTAIVRGVKFDDEKVRSIIQLQEKLGATVCRNRKRGGLGLYPLDKIKPPITFTTMPAEKIKFRPLEYSGVLNGRQILEKHQTGRAYAHIIEKEKDFPVFVDSAGTIMSMPPIINSHDVGKITPQTRNVFVEGTGPNLDTLKTCLNILVTTLADMGGTIFSMDVVYANKKITTPDLAPKKVRVDVSYANKILGLGLKQAEAAKLLQKMGFGYANGCALVPAYRADILHPIDLVEDVAIAYGYENFKPEIPRVATIGQESRKAILTRKLCEVVTGFGFLECNTYHLTSKEVLFKKTGLPESKTIETANALNQNYDTLRNSMLPGLLKILGENKHREYPQHLFDVGTVVFPDEKAQNRAKEQVFVALASAHAAADFNEIKSKTEGILEALGKKPSLRPSSHASFIKGRAAEIVVEGKIIGTIGEIHPKVLNNFEIEVPVAAAEIDVEKLFED